MNTLSTLAQAAALAFGAFTDGGHFGGVLQINGTAFAVIHAPKAEGEFDEVALLSSDENVPGAMSYSDSMANTRALAQAGSELAKKVLALTINGFTDWCLPARDVVELAYRHLKPTEEETYGGWRDGENPSSVPPGLPYACTAAIVQTAAEAFQAGNAEAFEDSLYWTSTQYRERSAWYQNFSYGGQHLNYKSAELRARAVRLIPLSL